MVHGIRANDGIELMLAVQMVATHFAATRALYVNTWAAWLSGAESVKQ